jgi:hypothetical protein
MSLQPAILCIALLCGGEAPSPTPILYSTDLFHPHDDPDDHYDLATLFALPEFEVLGVVLDLGDRQTQRTGRPAVAQMNQIAGRRVAAAVGLRDKLRTFDDKALDQPTEFQGAVEMILDGLRRTKSPAVIFTTGSCRDLAAALNREPDLLRERVRAVYINVGNGPNEKQNEWNVGLDPLAYRCVLTAGLPLCWCPCFGKDGYQTLYVADQSRVVGACTAPVQNFFVYCLTKSKAEPLEFLNTGPHPLPAGPRKMWCTAPLLHAAGRRVYERGSEEFVALPTAAAANAGLAGKEVALFDFVPMRAEAADDGGLRVALDPPNPNGRVFRATHPRYQPILAACLKNLLAELKPAARTAPQ